MLSLARLSSPVFKERRVERQCLVPLRFGTRRALQAACVCIREYSLRVRISAIRMKFSLLLNSCNARYSRLELLYRPVMPRCIPGANGCICPMLSLSEPTPTGLSRRCVGLHKAHALRRLPAQLITRERIVEAVEDVHNAGRPALSEGEAAEEIAGGRAQGLFAVAGEHKRPVHAHVNAP